jgi:hypothetical protein
MIKKCGAFRLILLLLLLLTVLDSCGIIIINRPDDKTETLTNNQGETVTENTVTTTEAITSSSPVTPVTPTDNEKIAQKYLDALTSRDFEGVGIVIATLNNTLFTPDNNDKPITKARLLRNRAVEKKYNTIIMSNVCASIDVMLTQAKEAQKSGMFYADMLAVPSVNLGLFKTEDLLFNLNSLPFTDYTAPYFNKDAMKQMSGGYNVYGAAGEMTEDMNYMYLMFFNRTIIKKYGIEDPYILVEDGKWTWDKMREIIITVNDDINASGGTPITGHASQTDTDTYINIMFASTGQHYMTSGVGIVPSVSYNTDSTNKLIETAHKLLYDDGTYYNENGNTDPALTAFNNGNVLFYVNSLYATSWFTDMKDSWGILPLPGIRESQNYYTYYDTSAPVMAVLSDGAGVERIGLLLQAMNAASYKYINDTYYNYLANYVLRDNGSINMLDYMRKNPVYDFAYMFGSYYPYVPDGTYNLLRKTIKKGTTLEPNYSDYSKTIYGQMSDMKAFGMLNK